MQCGTVLFGAAKHRGNRQRPALSDVFLRVDGAHVVRLVVGGKMQPSTDLLGEAGAA